MASNLYKVGDWVYCEVSPYQPYVIRRIEELTKTPCGSVEAKVICAFRRRDISQSLLTSVEKHHSVTSKTSRSEDESESTNDSTSVNGSSDGVNGVNGSGTGNGSELNDLQKYQLKHRELFYSKYTDTIPVTTIRSKCSVLLFNPDIEKLHDYLQSDDQFYYNLTYDPYQRTIVADKGEIKVGLKYQSEIPSMVSAQMNGNDGDDDDMREELQWYPSPSLNQLSEREIEQFLTIAKSIGTFARALDCNNAFKQPSLPLSAAAASRDITLFHAMNVLHENGYNIGKAALSLVTNAGPIICKDEMEDWSAAEANLFEDALEKYGKDFNEIRKDFLPWKSLKSIIEYYYCWKTTDRYVQQKRIKSSEQEAKLKQVYIPNHTKQNQAVILKNNQIQVLQQNSIQLKTTCESCGVPQAQQWYLYNPLAQAYVLLNLPQATPSPATTNHQQQTGNVQSRVCHECWTYWKKYASFKYQNIRDRINQLKNQTYKCMTAGCTKEFKGRQLLTKHSTIAHGLQTRGSNGANGGSPKPLLRNRASFYLLTTPLTQASRFVCRYLNKKSLRRFAKKVNRPIDFAEVNKEWEKEANRNIKEILDTNRKGFIKINPKSKLTNDVIRGIYRRKGMIQSDVEYRERIQMNLDGPKYLEYFQTRPSEPAYVPQVLRYERPDKEFFEQFYLQLMQQSQKQAQEQQQQGQQNHQAKKRPLNEISPSGKRTLLNQNNNTLVQGQSNSASRPVPQQPVRQMAKAAKPPIQSINLLNAPEDIFYHITKMVQDIRQDIDLKHVKKLARTPFKVLLKDQYQTQYTQMNQIYTTAMDHIKSAKEASVAAVNGTATTENDVSMITNSNSDGSEVVVVLD